MNAETQNNNPTTVLNFDGLLVLTGAEPQEEKVIDIRHLGYHPPKHPADILPLENKPLCSTVFNVQEFDGFLPETYSHGGIAELKGRIKIMMAQMEVPAMRITETDNGAKIYELTYPSAEYTYITPPLKGLELQMDFSNLFKFLSEIYQVECITESGVIEK